ncbi:hypothetical protein NZK32_08290 [Cyanobium sp. FGCU-52]|nr:hypothetical protein [Cyanobium sp. FGCU52]
MIIKISRIGIDPASRAAFEAGFCSLPVDAVEHHAINQLPAGEPEDPVTP